jgi:hypothetical protein
MMLLAARTNATPLTITKMIRPMNLLAAFKNVGFLRQHSPSEHKNVQDETILELKRNNHHVLV